MKFQTTITLLLLSGGLSGQSFYDLNTIQDIRIFFAFNDWDSRMDTAKAGADTYTLADSVRVNGQTFLNCGVKYKGNSTYDVNRVKNPLHIKLDYDKNADYQGFEDIKLGNGWSDNSMIREPLGYAILAQYMDAPRGNFAKVYINDTYYGLMNNAEDISSRFLLEHFYSSRYPFVKCNPVSIGTGLGNGPNLEYLGTEITKYNQKYEIKSDTGWSALIGLCDTLTNHFSDFDQIADMDRMIWMLAFNNATVNLDSYTGSFRQNYYVYRDHNGRWLPIVWDLNMCFGGFTVAGGTAGALTTANMPTMSYTLHKSESGWPLIQKILNDPFYSKMYFAHLRTMNKENFSNGTYKPLAEQLHALVDAEVQADPNSLVTYGDFQLSLTEHTPGAAGGGFSPGVFKLMDSRTAYLSNVLSATAPVISGVQVQNGDAFGTDAAVSATITDATNAWLSYRYSPSRPFVRVSMYDDGAHNDGAAGDKIYGTTCPVLGAQVQYYIYAENANTGSFSPERAEHEFYSFQPTLNPATLGNVVINELTANNADGIENEKGKIRDWIELYNNTANALDISHLYLSNNPDDLKKWVFPAYTFIAPNSFLLLFADDLDHQYAFLHTNFNLNKAGDRLILSDGSTILDDITFGILGENLAVARCPDGVGAMVISATRTPWQSNECTSSTADVHQTVALIISPNPTRNVLTIKSSQPILNVEVFDDRGVLMMTGRDEEISFSGFSAGMYWLRITLTDGRTIVRSVLKTL